MLHTDIGFSKVAQIGARVSMRLCWASLIPLIFVLRPYAGIGQDARIYLGRGLADIDPAGIGRDMMFSADEQTGFSMSRPLFRALLDLFPPDQVSLNVTIVGLVAWLAAAVVLLRCIIEGDRAVWIATVAVLVLPADYGISGVFSYAEALATPRIFAEAAVLGSLAALLSGRRILTAALLLLATGFHPLMALPGVALAVLLWLPRAGRTVMLVATAAMLSIVAAAAAGAPLLGRLFTIMDPVWFDIVRHRSITIFPSQWTFESFGLIASHAAAAIVAASLLKKQRPPSAIRTCVPQPSPRAFLLSVVVVAIGGVLLSYVLGDLARSTLILQIQIWRALWLLSVMGNAGLAISAVKLWRGDTWSQLVLALLVFAWSGTGNALLVPLCAGGAVAMRLAHANRQLPAVSVLVGRLAIVGALLLAAIGTVSDLVQIVGLLAPLASVWWTTAPWLYVVGSGALAPPLLAGGVALALAPAPWLRCVSARALFIGALAILCIVAILVWDSRTAERRMIDARDGAAEIDTALGPGEGGVLWIDDENTATWFLARRPAFFNAIQGAPIVFSRALASEWSERAAWLRGLGLVRQKDVSPWSMTPATDDNQEIAPSAASIATFCADPRNPAGLVIPGQHLNTVPPGLPARLWRPAAPILRLSFNESGPAWRSIDVYTIVSCRSLART